MKRTRDFNSLSVMVSFFCAPHEAGPVDYKDEVTLRSDIV